jgi:hypothetical protein
VAGVPGTTVVVAVVAVVAVVVVVADSELPVEIGAIEAASEQPPARA